MMCILLVHLFAILMQHVSAKSFNPMRSFSRPLLISIITDEGSTSRMLFERDQPHLAPALPDLSTVLCIVVRHNVRHN